MKKVLLIITGIIIFISVPIFVFFFSQQQELRSKAAPATTLALQPAAPTVAVGDTVIWKVIINTAENRVATVKISLTFDATKFESLSMTNGPLAPKIMSQGTVGSGTATITVAAENTTKPISGQGEIATLRLKAIAGSATPVTVQFAPDTYAAGLGEKVVNVLTSTTPGTITITGGDVTPLSNTTPATTPLPTPLNSPTGSPIPTPTHPAPTPTVPVGGAPLEIFNAQPSTPSALTLSVATEATRGGLPLISGVATPSATVTVVIYATPPQTIVVSADSQGNWKTTPTTNLAPGTYSIVVSAQLGTSPVQTISSSFTIASAVGGTSTTTDLTGNALPESGSTETTLILLLAGGTLILVGLFSLRKKMI